MTLPRRSPIPGWRRLAGSLAVAAVVLGAVYALNPEIGTAIGAISIPADFLGGSLYTVWKYAALFLNGALTTVAISLFGTVAGFMLALGLVWMRLQTPGRRDGRIRAAAKRAASWTAKAYVAVFRGTPMIVQAAFFWYGLGLFGDAFVCGLFVVSVNTAAYIAEILRGGIAAVDPGQREAARSLGMSAAQSFFAVVFPQALKHSLPAVGNEFIINVKDTAVLSVIGIFELFNQTRRIAGIHYRQLEAYFVVAVIYFALTMGLSKLLAAAERRFDLPRPELPSSN